MTIYFVEMVDEPWIKIGYTAGTAEKRMAQLQTGQPQRLRLVGTIEGDRDAESGLHKHFADLRHNGEWFEKTEKFSAIILDLISNQRPWYFCRMFSVAIKKMENAWVEQFAFPIGTDRSAYDDCTIKYELLDTESQLAKVNKRIDAYTKRHGNPPPWANIIRGQCWKRHKLSVDPRTQAYLKSWRQKGTENNAALGA